jgi:hypothetical protein
LLIYRHFQRFTLKHYVRSSIINELHHFFDYFSASLFHHFCNSPYVPTVTRVKLCKVFHYQLVTKHSILCFITCFSANHLINNYSFSIKSNNQSLTTKLLYFCIPTNFNTYFHHLTTPQPKFFSSVSIYCFNKLRKDTKNILHSWYQIRKNVLPLQKLIEYVTEHEHRTKSTR